MTDLVLIVDLETTEADPHQINELGAVLYSVKHQTIICTHSHLIGYSGEVPTFPNTISQIPQKAIAKWGASPLEIPITEREIVAPFSVWPSDIDFMIAHNTDHEKKYIESEHWLCTYRDFELFEPGYCGSRNLFAMAIANNVGISQGHRAIYDSLLIAEIFNRRRDLQHDFEIAQVPHIEAIAPIESDMPGFRWDWHRRGWFSRGQPDISQGLFPDAERIEAIAVAGYDQKDLVKSYGFSFHPESKTWRKLVNINAFNAYPFPLSQC